MPDILEGYIDVAERITIFREKFPEGSLQPVDPKNPFEILNVNGDVYLVYSAAAYRDPNDRRPGIGVAWEKVPGETRFTRTNEVMVAETSVWGRAIVAALAADTRTGIASADEIRAAQERNRQDADAEAPQVRHPSNDKATDRQQGAIRSMLGKKFGGEEPVELVEAFAGSVPPPNQMTKRQASQAIDILKAASPPPKAERRGPVAVEDPEERPF